MRDAKEVLDETFLEMRWRALSLAADLDRIERAEGGAEVLKSDQRVGKLREAIELLMSNEGNRAEGVQRIFSDTTAPVVYRRG